MLSRARSVNLWAVAWMLAEAVDRVARPGELGGIGNGGGALSGSELSHLSLERWRVSPMVTSWVVRAVFQDLHRHRLATRVDRLAITVGGHTEECECAVMWW
jgi:hypothetical protein